MVIIGILAAVSVPRFANVVRQSEAASEPEDVPTESTDEAALF